MAWIWIGVDVALAIHDEQIAEHSGASGCRDLGLLQSALARPINQASYGNPDIADLAAAYCIGIVRSHPFLDGNKRTGFVLAELFLELNGCTSTASDLDCVTAVMGLADGTLGDADFAAWIRAHLLEIR